MTKASENLDNVLARINKYPDEFRSTCQQLHELIMKTAPHLQPRLWYGMPGYANKTSEPVIIYFRPDKYISFGITDSANVDHLGNPSEQLVATAWYLTKLTPEIESQIVDIINKVTRA